MVRRTAFERHVQRTMVDPNRLAPRRLPPVAAKDTSDDRESGWGSLAICAGELKPGGSNWEKYGYRSLRTGQGNMDQEKCIHGLHQGGPHASSANASKPGWLI